MKNPALRSASRLTRQFRRFSEDCFKPPHWRVRSAHFSALLRFREIVLAKILKASKMLVPGKASKRRPRLDVGRNDRIFFLGNILNLDNNKNNNVESGALNKFNKFIYYTSLPIINLSSIQYNNTYIKVKGAVLSDVSKIFVITLTNILFFYFFIDSIKKEYDKYYRNITFTKILKELLFSPFFILWIIIILDQFIGIYFFKRSIIVIQIIILYIIMFYSQYLFLNKIKKE